MMWDEKTCNRKFEISDEVLLRKPGRNLKLSESWESPYTVTKQNSPLSYAIDTGDRQIPSIHIQLMKGYDRDDNVRVSRVTSVFEPDNPDDDIIARYAEAHIGEAELSDNQKQKLNKLLATFPDVMTSEPGLTTLVDFAIETGDSEPIFQHPYNTPASFKSSIDTEIDWLLEKGYV